MYGVTQSVCRSFRGPQSTTCCAPRTQFLRARRLLDTTCTHLRPNAVPKDTLGDLDEVVSLARALEPADFGEIDWGSLDESDKEESDSEKRTYPGRKRGRKKGAPLEESTRLKIKEAMKGKNTYKRTALHRARISQRLRKAWIRKRASGEAYKLKRCSICGEEGHNRRGCPQIQGPQTKGARARRRLQKRQRQQEESRQHGLDEKNESPQKAKGRCSVCGAYDHDRRTCPIRKMELAAAAVSSVSDENRQKSAMEDEMWQKNALRLENRQKQLERSEEESLERLYKVPVKVDQMWTLALDCAVRACKDGINRQMLNFTFPMLRDGAPMGPPLPSNSDMARQFRVATLIVEAVLNGVKKAPELEGRLDVSILDEEEGTVYWEGDHINAILFPQPDTLDTMISRGMMSRSQAPRLQLIVNPLWQPGQVVSDFGFGQLKTLRENFVESFEDVFFMKQISVFSDVVIVMRCYGTEWQVHLVEPSGKIALVDTSKEKPDFDNIYLMLRKAETSLSSRNWIDRLKTKYIERQKRLSPFPLSISKAELEKCFDGAEISVADRIHALNSAPRGKAPSRREQPSEVLLDTDIVTGEVVHDIRLDPLHQFGSLLGQKRPPKDSV